MLHDDGTISGEPAADRTVQAVLRRENALRGKLVMRHSDPTAWFEALPGNYSGTYFRARMRE
ncbi:MAG TPA: hypothetical protein VGS58_03500 [Candidatus Sulfopaludibacter sp.]|nr:hypothetical protein [Candidatus Sulfopaludibacter sp.]